MGIKRIAISIADKCTSKVDKKMIDYVSKFVSDDMSDLEKAISIYLCLGDVLTYNPYFALTHDYRKTNMVRDINLDNHNMICKNWSILYCRLLKYFGIKAKLDRHTSHYKVNLTIDGIIYSMDATAYGGYGYRYGLSDTAKIKFGLRISRFTAYDTVKKEDYDLLKDASKELDKLIDKVYEKQNRKVIPEEKIIKLKEKIVDMAQTNGRVVGVGSISDIEYRMKIINRFWGLNINDQGVVEKIQLFNSFFKYLFEDYEDYGCESKSYCMFAYKDHKLMIYKIIAIVVDHDYYYFIDDGKQFKQYTREEVINEFRKRNARISEFTEIPGLFVGLQQYKVKVK